MTGNVIIRHSYKVERVKKVYSVYELTTTSRKEDSSVISPLLTDLIRIEKFRFYSNGSGFKHYLRLRDSNNWQSCTQVTGLFKTKNPGVYYGDHMHNGKNLLIFKFSENREQLTIDYYLKYCPYHRSDIITSELKAIISRY